MVREYRELMEEYWPKEELCGGVHVTRYRGEPPLPRIILKEKAMTLDPLKPPSDEECKLQEDLNKVHQEKQAQGAMAARFVSPHEAWLHDKLDEVRKKLDHTLEVLENMRRVNAVQEKELITLRAQVTPAPVGHLVKVQCMERTGDGRCRIYGDGGMVFEPLGAFVK